MTEDLLIILHLIKPSSLNMNSALTEEEGSDEIVTEMLRGIGKKRTKKVQNPKKTPDVVHRQANNVFFPVSDKIDITSPLIDVLFPGE